MENSPRPSDAPSCTALEQRLTALLSLVTELLAGQTIDGRYELERVIRGDALGCLYEARDLEQRVPIHVRVLKTVRSPAPIPTPVEPVPHTSELLDLGVTDAGLPFAVLEPRSGETLADRLLRHKPITPAEALAWSRMLAEALAGAHARGVVHGYLDPDAVFVSDADREPSVLVLGFEVRELLSRADTALVLGIRAPFCAPETRAGAEPAPASDTYALALLLGTLFSSSVPPANATPPDLLRWATTAVSRSLAEIAAEALDHDPGRRPAAADFAEALRTTPAETR